MLSIKKLVIGVRPATTMFRVQSTWGDIADAVLAVRKNKLLGEQYYSTVSTTETRDAVALRSEEPENMLSVRKEDVVFTKSTYTSGAHLNTERALEEFSVVWKAVNAQLHMKDVRRIGIIGEGRVYEVENEAKLLLESLTKLDVPKFPGKFTLRYEKRVPTKEGLAPDVAKGDFTNFIYSYYESSIDADAPEDNAINANLDYQRYYAPPLSSEVPAAVEKHFSDFERRWHDFSKQLSQMGLVTHG